MSPPKRILVLHFPNLNNYGTAMMGINAIQGFRNHLGPEVEFVCDFRDTMCTNSLLSELGEGPWRLSRFTGIPNPFPSRLYKLFKLARPFLRGHWLSNNCDAIVVLGGDDFSCSLDWRKILDLTLCGRSVPVALLGQTIGPFSSRRDELLAKILFRNIRISARDPSTIDYLSRTIGVNSAELGADLAWIDLPHQNSDGLYEETAGRLDLERDQYISIVVSQLWDRYASDLDTYLARWIEIITALLRHSALRWLKLCLLPHTIGPNYGNERELIRVLSAQLPEELRSRIVVVDEVLYPTRTRLILGNGLFTITGRMHAAVSTFQMGRPAISLAYSAKYSGVIGRALGRADLIIEGAGPEKWQDGRIVRQVLDRVDRVIANEMLLRHEIVAATKRQKILAESALRTIAHWVSTY